MGYVTGQSFLETVDGATSLFTTAQAYQAESLQPYQGNLPLAPTAFLEVSTNQVRFLDPATVGVWQYANTANTLYRQAHGLTANTPLVLWSTVTDGLPSGLFQTVVYYVIPVNADTFQISLFVDGPAVTFAQSSAGLLSLAQPEAPLVANGDLWFNAIFTDDPISQAEVVGFWALSEWQTRYGSDALSLAEIHDVLSDAVETVQNYVTEATWTLCLSSLYPYRVVRRVIGELALWYLQRAPGKVRRVKSARKRYTDGIKDLTQDYDVSSAAMNDENEATILAQLAQWKRPLATTSTTAATVWFGSGQFIGPGVLRIEGNVFGNTEETEVTA